MIGLSWESGTLEDCLHFRVRDLMLAGVTRFLCDALQVFHPSANKPDTQRRDLARDECHAIGSSRDTDHMTLLWREPPRLRLGVLVGVHDNDDRYMTQ